MPYGKRVIGHLIKADPFDACSPVKVPQTVHGSPLLLIKRGECSFVTKAKYAQIGGAKLAIIADNIYEESVNITMGDDGLGNSVSIPSIFVSEQTGK